MVGDVTCLLISCTYAPYRDTGRTEGPMDYSIPFPLDSESVWMRRTDLSYVPHAT